MVVCTVMNKECKQIFLFIKESIKEIKESQNKHLEGSMKRQDDISQIKTDIEVIKTNLTNHLAHHTDLKEDFQWKVGLIVGGITFLVSLAVSVVFNLLK